MSPYNMCPDPRVTYVSLVRGFYIWEKWNDELRNESISVMNRRGMERPLKVGMGNDLVRYFIYTSINDVLFLRIDLR